MGDTISKSSSEVYMDTLTQAFMKNMNNCTSSATMNEEISIHGDGNVISDVSQASVQKFTVTCSQDSQAMANFQTNMSSAIKQAAKDQNVALLNVLGSTDAEVDSKIHESVKNVINLQNIQNIVNMTNQQQGINVYGNNNVVRNISQQESLQMLASNSQKVLEQISAVAQIKAHLDQKASSVVENPISQIIDSVGNALAEVWNAFTGPIKWILIVIMVVAVAYFLSYFFTPAEKTTEPVPTSSEVIPTAV
jgi:hypothetical protein